MTRYKKKNVLKNRLFRLKLPVFSLCIAQKSPGYNAAVFLALRHIDSFYLGYVNLVQGFVNAGKMRLFRHQSGKPQTLHRVFGAFVNHLGDETEFATGTP